MQCEFTRHKDNILISESGVAQLAHFSTSRVLMSVEFANWETPSNDDTGPLRWMAIEQLTAENILDRFSFASDIWSFGMTVYVCSLSFFLAIVTNNSSTGTLNRAHTI